VAVVTRARLTRRLISAAVIVAATSSTGCGADREPAPVATVTIPVTTAVQAAVPSTTPARTRAEHVNPTPTARPRSTPPARPRPKPVAAFDPSGAVPLTCLRRVGLLAPTRRGPGLWAGKTAAGTEVVVDGPYKSTGKAKKSATSLSEVSSAEAGGRYVASAALRSKLPDLVHEVARCLRSSSSK
jgi:hypothetical protein